MKGFQRLLIVISYLVWQQLTVFYKTVFPTLSLKGFNIGIKEVSMCSTSFLLVCVVKKHLKIQFNEDILLHQTWEIQSPAQKSFLPSLCHGTR